MELMFVFWLLACITPTTQGDIGDVDTFNILI